MRSPPSDESRQDPGPSYLYVYQRVLRWVTTARSTEASRLYWRLKLQAENELSADREEFKAALQRTAILSNEKYRGIRLIIRDNGVVLQAHNPEQEEAEEELEVSYKGDDIEIGFNVNYLLDALGAIESETVTLSIVDGNSSCLLREPGKDDCKYVVMPMRL